MKRFLTPVLLGVLLSPVLGINMPVFAQDATGSVSAAEKFVKDLADIQKDSAQAAGDKSEMPPGCVALIGDGGSMKISDLTAEASNDIIVLLSEGITRTEGKSVSCSEVIYCLRKKYGTYKSKDGKKISQTAAIRDKLVLSYLQQNKEKYNGCYVSGTDGLNLLNNYARMIYQWIAGVVGSVCILILIFSGIQISLGGVNPDDVQAAKDRISRSLIGLVVLFLSALILYTINPIFFG